MLPQKPPLHPSICAGHGAYDRKVRGTLVESWAGGHFPDLLFHQQLGPASFHSPSSSEKLNRVSFHSLPTSSVRERMDTLI